MKKATRQHTKQHNSRLILKTIYNTTGISRADIARNTGLTRAPVSKIVSAFIEDGLGSVDISPLPKSKHR